MTSTIPLKEETSSSASNKKSRNIPSNQEVPMKNRKASNVGSEMKSYSDKVTPGNQKSKWGSYIRHFQKNKQPTASVFLFVVNFHEPKYSPVTFLDEVYFPEFSKRFLFDFDVVYLGPKEKSSLRVINNHLPYYGFYSYYSLSYMYKELCVNESCNYAGFMLMNDDSYVDPMFLMDYDLTQSWFEPSVKMNFKQYWMWYKLKNPSGKTFLEAYNNSLNTLMKNDRWKKCHFELDSNHQRGLADFIYVAKKDIVDWIDMVDVMYSNRVFLEMAIPTVNWCISRKPIIDCNHGKMLAKHTCVHMHPVKYRQPRMKELALNRLYRKDMDTLPPRTFYPCFFHLCFPCYFDSSVLLIIMKSHDSNKDEAKQA